MEVKKISSAGDPLLVERNKKKIDPFVPAVIALVVQLVATFYLYSIGSSTGSIIVSAVLTIIYVIATYLLNTEPGKDKKV